MRLYATYDPNRLDPGLAALLTRLELTEYIETLARERITLRNVGELSDADLKELGLKMGDRRDLQRALREQVSQEAAVEGASICSFIYRGSMF